MGEPQIIRTDSGEELVVLSRRDYIMLLARLGDEDAEDEAGAILIEESDARIARGEDIELPHEVWVAMETGTHPVAALRRWRGLTQAELAAAAKITQGYLSEIENRKKQGQARVLKRLAKALAVPLDVIVG
jgi:DNA-binding XRE family transcriptional regulator